jgi:hypothetical protein
MNVRSVIVGGAAGSALMFMFDPARGRRRRTLVLGRISRVTRTAREGVTETSRDLANRASGVVARARARSSPPPDEATLVGRVRAKLGRVSSHPRAIDVTVADGEATLRGAVLSGEVHQILKAVKRVPGVRAVRNEMDEHETANGIPSLQGEGRHDGASELHPRSWTPAAGVMLGAGVVAAGVLLAARRGSHHESVASVEHTGM